MARPRLKLRKEMFSEALAKGLTVDDCVKELRISRSSAYRWAHELEAPLRKWTRRGL
jgi:transposase